LHVRFLFVIFKRSLTTQPPLGNPRIDMSSSLVIKLATFALLALIMYLIYQQIPQEAVAYKLLLFIVGGLIVGIPAALIVAPALGDKLGDFFYNAPEKVVPIPGSAARAKMAQGDYEGAVDEFIKLAESDPSDRTPWVEILRIQREKLADPQAALDSAMTALAAHEWPEDDEAFFLFRIVEISRDELVQPEIAVDALNTIVEKFPETRNSANAMHMLREMNTNDEPPSAEDSATETA